MSLDEMSTAAPEQEAPAIEPTVEASEAPAAIEDGPIDLDAPEAEASSEGDTEPVDTENDEEASQDPFKGFVDVEIDGKVYKVPEEVKDGYLRQADYTRKTQEAAVLRKTLEAKQAEIEQKAQITDQEIGLRVELSGLYEKLQSYEGVNWDAVEQNDPLLAQSEWRKFQMLQGQFNQKYQQFEQAQKSRSEMVERDIATRLKETADFAKREIKGWTPDLDTKITQFAVSELGFDVDTLRHGYNPRNYKTLYYAYLGRQAELKQQTAKPSTPTLQPTATVTAKASPAVQKNPEDMSMEEYAAYRKQQLSRGRR